MDLCAGLTVLLKRPCIEFGVVRIDSAMVVCIHSAKIQLLLTRRVAYSSFGPEISPSATFEITNFVGYG